MTRVGRLLRVGLAALAASAVVTPPAQAQAGRSQVRDGNQLYEEGRFEEAHEKYLEGLAAAPESPVILFNDGNALYQSEDYQRAVEAYRRAIESGDPELESAAWYNLGNALYRGQQLEESLEAFKQSLRLNPRDQDAKHNLERVLDQLQQQQNQNQQQNQQDQDQNQQSQDQDQQNGEQDRQQSGGQQDEEPEQDEPRDERSPQDEPGDQDDRESSQSRPPPQPEPGQMTQDEAERLLDAIDEDPEDVDRRRLPATGRRPSRPW